MRLKNFLISSVIVQVFVLCPSISQANSQTLQAPQFNNLGSFHHKVSTKVPLAQDFFDQGFVLFYGFEWGESIRSFKEATLLDPNCGMCYWGLALALGYKGNAPMTGHEYSDAQTAIKKALSLSSHEPHVEQAYIKALSLRFQHRPKPSNTGQPFSCHSNGGENASQKELLNYAEMMKKLTTQYPQDNDAKALYAYALFDYIAWKFWDADEKINKDTPNLIKTLESILANDKLNIGGNHYYVHVIEQSPHPEQALVNAERLKILVPGSEHLIHMPTHIYFLTGRYHDATDSNLQAINVYQHYSKIILIFYVRQLQWKVVNKLLSLPPDN
jgi:tetratricopeptide (TPR) repeat protein